MLRKAGFFLPIFFVASLLFLATPPQAHAALIGHWTLDADDINWSTGAVTDTSGNGNNGTVHNLDASDETAGQVDGGLNFNGTNSYISVPVNGSFPPSGNSARTVCMWFKPTDDSWTPDVNSIFEYGVGGDSFGIDMDSFPNIQFYTWHNDLLVAMGIAGHKDDWLQICWVWDGTSSSLLYSNGVLRGSQNFGSSINTPQTEVSIGRSALTAGYFPGTIDDVRMYDTAFTDDQIASLYDEATNPVAISNIASTTGETTATVTWDTAATSSDSTVWYGASSGTYTIKISSTPLIINHSIGLTGLTPFTTYYYVVVSKDNAGDIATSSEQTLTTVDLTPPVISSVVASPSSNSATVTWTTNESASTRLAYGLTSAYSTYTSETDTSPRVTSHSKNMSSLLACTIYHYGAVSRDAAGNTATSSDETFTTSGCDYSATPTSSSSGTINAHTTATTTVTDSGKSFSVGFTATSTSLVIQIKAIPSTPVLDTYGKPEASPQTVGVTVFDVKAIINGSTVLDSFDVPVTITYQYTDSEISGLDESSLKLYHYHDGAWVALDNCSVNESANTISCTTSSFSVFGLFGSSLPSSSSSPSGGGSLPWCSGPQAPGWNSSLPNGGCGTTTTVFARTNTGTFCPYYHFTRQLRFGDKGPDVQALQKFLNCAGFSLGSSGPGSPGQETTYFVDRTLASLKKFQQAYASEILAPIGTTVPTGIFAQYSQKEAYSLMEAQ
ncbi:MAG TPA: LamG-like jellyroll fold domain-containing protein [Candidatus Paceibacterota bacterium]|nr:LamG-like jellyroll fold domain-containing protein [Candidatus Paceibacterota bacterium]